VTCRSAAARARARARMPCEEGRTSHTPSIASPELLHRNEVLRPVAIDLAIIAVVSDADKSPVLALSKI
jgi:hypothetical protein